MNRNRRRTLVAAAAALFLAVEVTVVQLYLPLAQGVRLAVCGAIAGATALWLWAALGHRFEDDDSSCPRPERGPGTPRCEGGRATGARARGRGTPLP
ncbi:hypothetical protein AB0G74_21885 [Streptomyces sp. NPDC020875]|uniref:hypothetical protein n=1 Tax=Streptomyces sp. NPDC020875 TaxID=3154898 RepID=UPI0033FE65AE